MAEIILNEGNNIDNTIDGMLQTAKLINEESIKYNNLYLQKLLKDSQRKILVIDSLCQFITENGSFIDEFNGLRSQETSVEINIFTKKENPFVGVESHQLTKLFDDLGKNIVEQEFEEYQLELINQNKSYK